MRPVFDPTGGPDVLVEKMIGTAYETVKRVYCHLPEIRRLDGVLTEIPILAQTSVDNALAVAMPPILAQMDEKVQAAEGWAGEAEASAEAAAQSALAATKVNMMFPFTFSPSQVVYDVTVISGQSDVNTAGLALWVEGAIEFDFTILSATTFMLNNATAYPNNAQMRIIVNAHFNDLVHGFDQLLTALEQEYIKAAELNGRWCGLHLVPPTTRINGDPLQEADEYQNRGDKLRYSWNGSAWIALNSSAQQLEERLADLTSPAYGAGKIAVYGTGKMLDEILNTRVFPGIVLDHATTSWAKIVSADFNQDNAVALGNLLDTKRSVTVDTQVALNSMVLVSKDRTQMSCSPGGVILAGPAMSQKTMLRVTGHHAILDKMNMDNPLSLKATTGGRQTAIEIRADHATIMNGTFRRMLHAVVTEAGGGEWYMPTYLNNFAYDCLGVGAGAGDTGANGYGEDRGDAFLIWGSTGIMAFNRAVCGADQDARIAFHCEWLGTDFQGQPYDPKRDGFDQIMVHNYALGAFRRHFAFESIRRGIMSQNVSLGGATWWPLAVTGGWECLVTDMRIHYDRTAANNAGAAWSPDRAAIGFGHNGTGTTLRNIKVSFAADAAGKGLTSLVTNMPAFNATLQNIQINKPVGQGSVGYVMDKLPDATMIDCSVTGAATGLTTFGPQDITIKGFTATDISGTAIQVSGGSAGTHVRVEGGRILRANRGVNATNLTSLSIRGLQTKGIVTADVEQFGTTGAITLEGNHNEDGLGKFVGLGSPFTPAMIRNVSNNPGYSYDLKYTITSFTDATSGLNTHGKFQGKVATRSDGVMLAALGATPTSPWGVIATTTPVTPA